ncbi:Lrp/AsnC family transcriptional regulator [Komagataeibacter xylinus]|uniref:Lrp/AsnC family transcriptional regulator n=1 Tax=Komagataeibacter xylinus TaxID=28448 RepID=UPI000FDF6B16|nr:Lrp/AsnC family transcriptional regulator [Komagataeibacter xylinus]AZV38124.1 AsnC family transcriptional regulator [Komagataeibacter xylinus]
MSISGKTTINPAEEELINLLRENARMPVALVARRLGISRSTAQSRLEKLERQGVIEGYSLRLAAAYAESYVCAHMLVTLSPKYTASVQTLLRRIPEVRTIYSVSGNFDMIVMVEARSITRLDTVIDEIGSLDGVERTMSSMILSTRLQR